MLIIFVKNFGGFAVHFSGSKKTFSGKISEKVFKFFCEKILSASGKFSLQKNPGKIAYFREGDVLITPPQWIRTKKIYIHSLPCHSSSLTKFGSSKNLMVLLPSLSCGIRRLGEALKRGALQIS
jgi:hypothetical protein